MRVRSNKAVQRIRLHWKNKASLKMYLKILLYFYQFRINWQQNFIFREYCLTRKYKSFRTWINCALHLTCMPKTIILSRRFFNKLFLFTQAWIITDILHARAILRLSCMPIRNRSLSQLVFQPTFLEIYVLCCAYS